MTKQDGMKLTRLRALLDAYGAQPHLWPDDERDAAADLLGSSAEARSLHAEVAALDRVLLAAPRTQPSPELVADILAAAAPSPWRRWASALWPFGSAWQPAAALVTALVLGIAVGPLLPGQTGEQVDLASLALDGLVLDGVIVGEDMP